MKKILLISLLLLGIKMGFAQSIERIDPQNWWVGMKYNTITLLVYGKDIAGLQPSLSYEGVELMETQTVENKNYLFVTIRIDAAAKPGNVKLKFSRSKKVVLTKDFPLLQRENDSASRKGFSQKDAIYLIFPDRFANGDESNDEIASLNEKTIDRKDENARHGGDIKGIIDHLDYVASLGFTQIWCTPLIENNQPKYSYHGYAATDFYQIDPRFGTNEMYKELSMEAKKRGIGMIWDVVLNHCGAEYYFIKDMPEKDWVNFHGTRTRTNHMKSTLTDIYATEIDKKEYVDGWFDDHMADLNQRNPLVASYLIQNNIWWIEYAGLSGLREDTFSYADKDFLATWTKTILEEYPNLNIVGEELTSNVAQVAYWQIDKKNEDGYRCYLPTLMDFSLTEKIISSLNNTDQWFSTWRDTYQSVAQDYLFPHPYDQMIMPDNHDLDRFYSRLKKDFDNWKLGIAMYMTMRGIPQFYYGTEVLMTNEKAGSDGQRRGDFYGGWKGDTKNAFTGAGLTEKEKEAQQYFSRLLNWRKNNTAVTDGKFKHYAPQKNDVYIYFRYTDNEKVMVLLNKNSEAVTLDLKRYSEMIDSSFKAKDIVSGKEMEVAGTLTIPAKTAMILEVK
ncbi:glycoside hydrolase family 13 protein [Limibacter armeniacum]|uniref:glycoside hydrolase family 13 protein n=1 Tax=Limibacter armeniacum TaxID=466084 RepID=UPI002FE6BB20